MAVSVTTRPIPDTSDVNMSSVMTVSAPPVLDVVVVVEEVVLVVPVDVVPLADAVCCKGRYTFWVLLQILNKIDYQVFFLQVLKSLSPDWNIDVCETRMPPFPNISRTGLTFHPPTWISIRIIYSSWTIYLLGLKVLGQSIFELSVAQGVGDQHDLWHCSLTYWPEYQ